ncbi:MAG: diacylglycerol kinase family lipid kinase [Bacteroidia bacterium]|nr:diacylglycerol kinase family lipid kinase [Bacteroidia bacterium]
MKKSICFIINPISGTGKQKQVEQLLSEVSISERFSYDIVYTQKPHHATELSKAAVDKNYDIVVAVGGDGSVNEVSKGLLHSSTKLGILPCGSGNGFARHLSIPMDLKAALDVILNGNSQLVDSGEINGHHFINIAGIGFDAHIAHLFSNFGKRGFLAYIQLVLKEFFKYKMQSYELKIDVEGFMQKAFLLSFANGSQFGNNAFISPNSKINDGSGELCILQKIPLLHIPYFAYLLFSKKAHKSRFIQHLPFKKLEVKSGSGKIHLDGEAFELDREFTVTILPNSLQVLIP